MIQILPFQDGGFVIHRAYVGCSTMKHSAWFGADDALLDAECFDAKGRSRPVARASKAWAELQRGARLYRRQMRASA